MDKFVKGTTSLYIVISWDFSLLKSPRCWWSGLWGAKITIDQGRQIHITTQTNTYLPPPPREPSTAHTLRGGGPRVRDRAKRRCRTEPEVGERDPRAKGATSG